MNELNIEWKTEKRRIEELIPYENNPRILSQKQREYLTESLSKFGLVEIPVINLDNKIIAGHQRLAILSLLGKGQEEIDVRIPNRQLTEAEFKEYLLRSNHNRAGWDYEKLNECFSKDLLLKIGFGADEIKKLLNMQDKKEEARLKLMDRFIVPPFSILDARQPYWQDRKRAWLALTGALDGTREEILYKDPSSQDPKFYKKKTDLEKYLGYEITTEEFIEKYYDREIEGWIGTVSNFDPVLTEIIYTWFNPKGGKILDNFMGDPAKAVVAGELKMPYVGVDIREEQIKENEPVCAPYKDVKMYAGDANDIDKVVPDNDFDLIFTCPPYYDLEVYSKEDMSALGTYEEFMEQYKNSFKKAIDKLKDNRFVIVVVGEIRNRKTGIYRNFVGDNIKLFTDLGLSYYNEIILITNYGTIGIRAPRQFNAGRKVGKTHQNVLVFYKGQAEKLFKETKATYSVHETVIAFFKGDPSTIKDVYGSVVRDIDILKK